MIPDKFRSAMKSLSMIPRTLQRHRRKDNGDHCSISQRRGWNVHSTMEGLSPHFQKSQRTTRGVKGAPPIAMEQSRVVGIYGYESQNTPGCIIWRILRVVVQNRKSAHKRVLKLSPTYVNVEFWVVSEQTLVLCALVSGQTRGKRMFFLMALNHSPAVRPTHWPSSELPPDVYTECLKPWFISLIFCKLH